MQKKGQNNTGIIKLLIEISNVYENIIRHGSLGVEMYENMNHRMYFTTVASGCGSRRSCLFLHTFPAGAGGWGAETRCFPRHQITARDAGLLLMRPSRVRERGVMRGSGHHYLPRMEYLMAAITISDLIC